MSSAGRPNILLLMVDQMRFDTAGFAGHPLVSTPRLDELAAGGVSFDTAYCPSPVCSPARASWLTGLYPHAHLQLRNYGPNQAPTLGNHLPPATVTVGDVLADAGYRCGMVGCWHLGQDHAPQHGFSSWNAYRYLGAEYTDPLTAHFAACGVENLYVKNSPAITQYSNTMEFGSITDPRQQRTTWTVDRSLDFLEEQSGRREDEPFFLFASIKDPHPIMLVPPDVLAHYPVDEMPVPATLRDELVGKPGFHHDGPFRIKGPVTDRQIQEMIAHYYALITHIDTQVGRLLDQLEASGQADNTIVAFISDHGELLGDHGFTEKVLMYESSVRVPWLMRWPAGFAGGQRIAVPVSGVDLVPTLLELAGVALAERMDGRSLASDLQASRQPAAEPVFAEIASARAVWQGDPDPEQLAAHVMVRAGAVKYVRNRFDIDELYDLTADPQELHNLATEPGQAQRIAGLRREIAAMVGQTGPGPYGWCATP
jgi:arylsulfatase